MEGDNTGKRSLEDLANAKHGNNIFVKEMHFDDFFDSTPEKSENDVDLLELLQQRN